MVQVNPVVTDAATMEGELQALGSFLRSKGAEQGLPLTALWVQHHTGVANAAPADAPTAVVPGFGGPEGGGGLIRDALCQLAFRVSPQAFFQVNAGATCLLYHLAGSWAAAGPGTLLLDVCCGTGTIGITMAARVNKVVGIDSVASAIEDARANAALNGVTNATWVCGAAEKVIDSVLAEHAAGCDDIAAIVDPPRAGLHRVVLKALLGCSRLNRLVYIACNPDSLARDAGVLCAPQRREGCGGSLPPFRPVKAMAFDLFPHTPHVESVLFLER
ncbi:MAG: S-adenosyl-L-methionine-dependent methyltransferase [Monoraphidium minutum]|nr:MAG: S-adenosyl-L-methionine-dependent methyltransferase [Monoraphidium minutum]